MAQQNKLHSGWLAAAATLAVPVLIWVVREGDDGIQDLHFSGFSEANQLTKAEDVIVAGDMESVEVSSANLGFALRVDLAMMNAESGEVSLALANEVCGRIANGNFLGDCGPSALLVKPAPEHNPTLSVKKSTEPTTDVVI